VSPERAAERAQESLLSYDRFDPPEEGLRDALSSTGNGYFCTRGAAEWEDADDVHYPRTYAHGGYNRKPRSWGAGRFSTRTS
jgi:trehalose/maltose hydrolase-like predicted phosphorylase